MYKLKTTSAWLILATFAVGNAFAQTAPPAEPTAASEAPALGVTLQEVTVSASAISIAGYDQPTPVTSLGIQQIRSAAQPDLSDSLRQLPAFGNSSGPENSSLSDDIDHESAGSNQLSLRGLGPNRTLVLIDGQRLVEGTIFGGADVGEIPATLVERVDVVTGGASAIWGSDAVAGVVNYVMNHNFNGVEVDLEDSNNNQNLRQQSRIDITAGMGFDDNRGHIEASASEWRVPNVYFTYQTEGYNSNWLVNNPKCNLTTGTPNAFTGLICPPGQPAQLHGAGVGTYGATPGGIISGCLAGDGATTVPCSLTNTYFVGPNATPLTFNNANVSNGFLTNGGTDNTVLSDGGVKAQSLKNDTAFLFGSFKINDHLEATLQFNFGYTGRASNSSTPYYQSPGSDATIYSGNPYIPASVQSQMNAQGVGALSVGTTLTNPFTGPAPSIQAMQGGTALELIATSRRLLRGVFGLDGDIGANWSWKAYYERSEEHNFTDVFNMPYVQGIYNAEDAVRVGSYNAHYTAAQYPNPLGLVPGTITCLSNLLPIGAPGQTGPSSIGGLCSPLNIFGTGPGVTSAEAHHYIDGIADSGGDTEHTDIYQDVAAASVQGKLPVGTPAGPVALAAGLVYRREEGVEGNCGLDCNLSIFDAGDFTDFHGVYSVKEGSLELNAPLLKNQGVKDLSLDAAYRGIDYSTSGFVSTYKFGLVSQLVDALRLRLSYSEDIRAGDLQEQFQTPSTEGGQCVNPRTGAINPCYSISEGNPNIQPEKAETRTAGFVFTPIQGLTGSLDWYDIHIKDIIATINGSQVGNYCKQGIAAFCEAIVWGSFRTYPQGSCVGPSINSCPGLPVVAELSEVQNINSADVAGLDFLADYKVPFMAGALDFNTNENFVFHEDQTVKGTTCDTANSLSHDEGAYPGCGRGDPKFKGVVAVSYAQGGWLGTVQARMVGETHLVSQWIGTNTVDDDDIPFYTYLDLRLSYRFANGIQLYGAIDNVGDRLEPVIPSSAYSGNDFYQSTRGDLYYDGFGRVWRAGLRAKF